MTNPDPSDSPLTIEPVEGGWLMSHGAYAVTLSADAMRESARRLDEAVIAQATTQSSDAR
ncbi:MAG: hypothetical protein BGN86_11750 [Caulobacterales bacterium 68-7]|nr:MAG: hypothetical protein BGN86_11750 [Caulobacterales bacterium 68-7]